MNNTLCQQLKNGVKPIADWCLDIPCMYMDAEPESTAKNTNRCDGNSNIIVNIRIGDNEHYFSRRFLWMSCLEGKDFNVAFEAHPEYEWNENNDLSEVDLEAFEYIEKHHKDLLSPVFSLMSDEHKQSFKDEHLSCFE